MERQPDGNKRRILVLGSTPHTRNVTAYTWDNLPPDLNVADYDVVILNLAAFEDVELYKQVHDKLPKPAQFLRHIFSPNSEIIAVGQLRIPGRHFDWWLPVKPNFFPESGTEIREVETQFDYYFKHVKGWKSHIGANSEFEEAVSEIALVEPNAKAVRLLIYPIAQTRFKMPIAFRAEFETKGGSSLRRTTNVFCLPAPTEISPQEAINLILKHRYGLLLEVEAPDWTADHKLPNQIPVEAEISEYVGEIERLNTALRIAKERLHHESRFVKLLYEPEAALEPIVYDALTYLKAQVQVPQIPGREDGRLIDPCGRKGLLEIKSKTQSVGMRDIRQLDHWLREAIAEEEWDGKGIMVANIQYHLPPAARGKYYPDDCIRVAKQFGLALLTTTQLFQAICSYQEGHLDVQEFWDIVFNSNGLCDLPDLEFKEAASEGVS